MNYSKDTEKYRTIITPKSQRFRFLAQAPVVQSSGPLGALLCILWDSDWLSSHHLEPRWPWAAE